jgi:ubiquinone/menaquinone biosynthesis C-methylase UbiE
VAAFAREAHRVLAPGGRLYIAEVYYNSFLRALANPFIRLHPSGDVRIYAPKEIETLLNDNGFTCEPVVIEGKIQIVTATKCLQNSVPNSLQASKNAFYYYIDETWIIGGR